MLKKAVLAAAIALVGGASAQAALTGPVFPAALPAGPGNPTNNGQSSLQSGGRTFTFSGINTTQYSALYDAVDTGDINVSNTLSNTTDTLTFGGFTGTVATWTGTTLYNDGLPGSVSYQMPIEFKATLGSGPTWSSGPVPAADTGTDLLSSLSGTSASYTLTFEWLGAPVGSGYQALGNVRNDSNIHTSSTNSFYYSSAVSSPEPASLGLMGFGALGLLARRRRA